MPDSAADDDCAISRRQELLERLDKLLRKVLTEDRINRKEARVWLISSLSKLPVQPGRVHTEKMRAFVPSHHTNPEELQTLQPAVDQLLQLFIEQQPADAAAMVLRNPQVLRRFFSASKQQERVQAWFGHFNREPVRGRFEYGAGALARFALLHRETAWQLLEWQGRHPQTPVVVSSKPHYLRELDVDGTVRNMVRHCPDFWTSEELRQAVVSGPLLSLETTFFVRELRAALCCDANLSPSNSLRRDSHERRRGSTDGRRHWDAPVRSRSPSSDRDTQRSGSLDELEAARRWRERTPDPLGGTGAGWSPLDGDALRRALSDFLVEQPWPLLCRRLLHTLPDGELLAFARGVVADRAGHHGDDSPAVRLVYGDVRWRRMEDLLLVSALAGHGQQLWRLLADDAEEFDALQSILRRLQEPGTSTASAAAAQLVSQGRSSWRLSKTLLLEAWALQMYVLHATGSDADALERVMEQVGIKYQRHAARATASAANDGRRIPGRDEQSHTRLKTKNRSKHGKRSKKTRKRDRSESSNDELLPRDYQDQQAQLPIVEWELEGLHGAVGRARCSHPHVADVVTAHALTTWLREVEGR